MSLLPLTVIGGFLGAGKTTLVNHLLRTTTRRYGVLVNDFGALAIDAALIASRDGETIALTNGCVCCGGGEDLGSGLALLAARRPAIDHVIVEASGVGDPWRLAQLALVEPGFALEPLLVVVDAPTLHRHLDDRWVADTVRGQIEAAETIVLNRASPDAATARARAAIRALRPEARLTETHDGAVPEAALRFPVPARSRFRADVPNAHEFRTWAFLPPRPFDRPRLREVLGGLPPSVLRVKGFCALGPEAAPHLLQFAAGQWSLTPSAAAANGLVVIGTDAMPDQERLAPCFDDALVRG